MPDVEMKNFKIRACPRCGTKNINLTTPRLSGVYVKRAKCHFCGYSMTSRNAPYVSWMGNTSKSVHMMHVLRDLSRAPYTAYINDDHYNMWDDNVVGADENIRQYIKYKTGYKVVIKDAKTVGHGKIIDRVA